jgi:hypothetical protein
MYVGYSKNKVHMEIKKSRSNESGCLPVSNMSTVGFPRSLSNALMVSPGLKRDTFWRRLRKALLIHSRRVR